jgi:outer membrane lipoprotein-sorting protein
MWCVTAAALALAAAGAARADEKADLRAVLDKAIKARGGEEKLAKEKATTFKAKGKFYGLGEGIDYTSDYAIQPPNKFRMNMEFEAGGMKFGITLVCDGKKGWTKLNDAVTEMEEEAVAELLEEAYAGRVETLVPLVKDKNFELATLGDVKVGDQPAVGVRVSHKGHRDINLFFDKKSGLLIKTERTVKDQQAGGKERKQESFFSDYKEVDGVKHPTKLVLNRDGEKYVDAEMSEYEHKDKLDDATFAKP